MNRKDFLKSILVGAAIAPTLIAAKADPVQTANDFNLINSVKDPVSFAGNGVGIYNDYDAFEKPYIITGRTITIDGIHDSHGGQINALMMDRTARNYVINLPADASLNTSFCTGFEKASTLVFSGYLTQYEIGDTISIQVMCTDPKLDFQYL
jgi:hypothetical protein